MKYTTTKGIEFNVQVCVDMELAKLSVEQLAAFMEGIAELANTQTVKLYEREDGFVIEA